MAKKGSPKMPAAPDPQQTAAAQAASNKDTAIAQSLLNMTDVYTPYGQSTFTQIGGTPVYGQPQTAQPVAMPSGTPVSQAASGMPGEPYMNPDGTISRKSGTDGQRTTIPETMPGSSGYSDIPRFRQDITLSPFQQEQLAREQGIQKQFTELGANQLGQISSALSQPFDLSGLPANITSISPRQADIRMTVGANDFSSDRQKVEDALMERYMRTLDPQQARQEDAFRTQMANQGIELGSQAYSDAYDILNRGLADERDLARTSAVLGGGQEQSRLFGMDLSQGQFQNAAQQQLFGQDYQTQTFNANLANILRQQAIQEEVLKRTQPIQEAAMLLGQGGGVQLPQFSPAPQTGVSPVDVAGITMSGYNTQANAANQAAANQAGNINALLGAGGNLAAAYMLSDIRAKENIIPVGRENGLPVYHFNYKNDDRTFKGVIAQEIAELMPSAVHEYEGMLAVDYGKLGIEMQEVIH